MSALQHRQPQGLALWMPEFPAEVLRRWSKLLGVVVKLGIVHSGNLTDTLPDFVSGRSHEFPMLFI